MFETMRYVAVHAPQRDVPLFTLRLAFESSSFVVALLDARAGPRPREDMLEAVRTFMGSDDFIADAPALDLHQPLISFADDVRGPSHLDLAELERALQQATGQSAVAVRNSQVFQVTRRRLSDSIIAVMIAPESEPSLLADLSGLIRVLDLVDRLARAEEELAIPGAVDAVLTQSIVVPPSLFPLPPPTPRAVAVQPDPEPDDDTLATLRDRQARLRRAIRELLDRDPSEFQQPPPAPEPEPPRPAGGPAGSGTLSVAGASTTPAGEPAGAPPPAALGARGRHAVASARSARPDGSRVALLLRPEAMASLDDSTRAVLQELRAVPTTTPVPVAVARLESELAQVSDVIAVMQPMTVGSRVVRVGSSLVRTGPVGATPATSGATASAELALPPVSGVPETVGTVRPAGVGSLLLVKQHTTGYAAGAVAHIDNYLRGESKERDTRRLSRLEESFTVETETTHEVEHDLQTTKQETLAGEASKTIEQDQSFSVGVTVSAGYGPFFQVDANTQFATATSTTQTAKTAFSYAKHVIDRTVTRISERVRREQTSRTLEEFEEHNRHAVDNTGGEGHVVGIYQWVEQVLEAQIYDYGARLLFDFTVMEPPVFLHRALRANQDPAEGLVEPPEFTTRPQEIDQSTYPGLVHQYGVVGVEPPPPLFLTVSRAFDDKAETPGADFTASQSITLPPGYAAYRGYAVAAFVRWDMIDGQQIDPSVPIVRINLGREDWVRHDGDSLTHTFVLADEQGEIPVSLATLHAASYAVNIEVLCQRDHLRYAQWQLETHSTIMQAYLKMKGDYEQALAEAATRAGVQIAGRSALENRLIERAELKRHCISLLTAQHFDAFSSILESDAMLPRIDFEEADAEGRYVRFFELAFEWENMTYVFYPYFWGRKHTWLDRVLLRDVDPVHAEFLKSGAGRAVAPVRPGFERAVMHFLDTGQIWNGSDLPQIGSPLYVDILEEVRERLDAPGEEIPVFEPWEVRLPTTLVRLAEGATLPRWLRNDDGDWVPVEPDVEEDG